MGGYLREPTVFLGNPDPLQRLNIAAFLDTHYNQSLDAAGDTGSRALVQPSRELSWDGDTVVITPLPEPETLTE
jgi:hypothetical protein